MSVNVTRDPYRGTFIMKLKGIRTKVKAENLEEVIFGIAHYFGMRTTRIPTVDNFKLHDQAKEKCPLCRE